MRLEPVESMALTVALKQINRGEVAHPNIATTCILALSRLRDVEMVERASFIHSVRNLRLQPARETELPVIVAHVQGWNGALDAVMDTVSRSVLGDRPEDF